MKINSCNSYLIAAAMAALLVFGTAANAQNTISQKIAARLAAAATKIEAGCGSDINKFCTTVTAGEGRLMFCLLAHEDKLGRKCDYALYDASRKMDRALDLVGQAADACWNDIQKRCANIPEGGGRIAECLLANKAAVTKPCRAAVERFPFAK